MRPPEVLDQQAALIDYLDSGPYHSFMDSFLTDMTNKGKLLSVTSGKDLCEVLRTSLRVAQAFHVQAEMMPLLRAAAMDLEDDDHLVHSRLPAEDGFLIFDAPWHLTDVWGKTVSFAALHWRHGGASAGPGRVPEPGIWVTYFTDLNDTSDQITQQLLAEGNADALRRIGRWHVGHIEWIRYGSPVGPTELVTDEEYAKFATEGLSAAGATPNPRRMVVGLFRLLNQVLVEVADAPVDRDTTRRITRKNLPVRVQTIKLRRKERISTSDTHGDGHVDWQHQWPVRGHWAWRKCGADHPSAEEYEKGWHTRVYIAPYLKGPEDKPLLITDKVWGLSI